jgi:cell division protein FtsW
VISLFAFVVIRGLYRAMKLSDPFEQVGRAPAVRPGGPADHHQRGGEPQPDPDQGHDLPFISYGGLVHAGHGA